MNLLEIIGACTLGIILVFALLIVFGIVEVGCDVEIEKDQ